MSLCLKRIRVKFLDITYSPTCHHGYHCTMLGHTIPFISLLVPLFGNNQFSSIFDSVNTYFIFSVWTNHEDRNTTCGPVFFLVTCQT